MGLFRGWYGERSRDKAHEDKGWAEAEKEHEKDANKKTHAAVKAKEGVDHSKEAIKNDPHNRNRNS